MSSFSNLEMLIEFVNINKKVVANLILPQDGAVQRHRYSTSVWAVVYQQLHWPDILGEKALHKKY